MFDFNRSPLACILALTVVLSSVLFAFLAAENQLLVASDKILVVQTGALERDSHGADQIVRPSCPSPLIPKDQHMRALFMPTFRLLEDDNTFLAWLDSLMSVGTGHHRRRRGDAKCPSPATTEAHTSVLASIWGAAVSVVKALYSLLVVFPIRFAWSSTIALTPSELLLSLVLLLGSGAALEARLGSLRFCTVIILMGIAGGLLYLATLALVFVLAHVSSSGSHSPCGDVADPLAEIFLATIGLPVLGPSSAVSWICSLLLRGLVDVTSLIEVSVANTVCELSRQTVYTSHWIIVPSVAPAALILHLIYRLLTVTVVVAQLPSKLRGGYRSTSTNRNRKRLRAPSNGSTSSSSNNAQQVGLDASNGSSGCLSRRSSPCVVPTGQAKPTKKGSVSVPTPLAEESSLAAHKLRVFYVGAVRAYTVFGFLPLVDASVGCGCLSAQGVQAEEPQDTTLPLDDAPPPMPPPVTGSSTDLESSTPEPAMEDAESSSSDDDGDANDRPILALFGASTLGTTFLSDVVALQLWFLSATASSGWVFMGNGDTIDPNESILSWLQYVLLWMPLSLAALPFGSRLLPVLWSTAIISHIAVSSTLAKTAQHVLDKAVARKRIQNKLQLEGLHSGRKHNAYCGWATAVTRRVSSLLSSTRIQIQNAFLYITGRKPDFATVSRSFDDAGADAEMRVVPPHRSHTSTEPPAPPPRSISKPNLITQKLESLSLHQLPEDIFVSVWLKANTAYRKAERRTMEKDAGRRWLAWQSQQPLVAADISDEGPVRSREERRAARVSREKALYELRRLWYRNLADKSVSWILYCVLRVFMVPSDEGNPSTMAATEGRRGAPTSPRPSTRSTPTINQTPRSRFTRAYRLRRVLESTITADFLGPIRRLAAATHNAHANVGATLEANASATVTLNENLHREFIAYQRDLRMRGPAVHSESSDEDIGDEEAQAGDWAYSDSDDEHGSEVSAGSIASRRARGDAGSQIPPGRNANHHNYDPLRDLIRYYRHRPEFVTVTFVDDSLVLTAAAPQPSSASGASPSTAPHISSPADANFTPPIDATIGPSVPPLPRLSRSVSEDGASLTTEEHDDNYHAREPEIATQEAGGRSDIGALIELGVDEERAREALQRGGSVEGAIALLFGS